ncbi:putative Uncharacterized transporter C3B8.04c [Glarea lozoyensis 74030]|uniref:Putative Uncharacterized transporter C3B8.04c n=1 Tax=Glarea lozoyensis (strain ATCC 74030 / MF5533) TaxID=1104152 RepID=H0ETB2_GLAL7|nr:putative Uncharacterized transporter C3B8.04c [Glarea lozoyensis 74030]
MKFSHSIQFNAVPDWSSHYIAYSNLKKLIYALEKTIHRPPVGEEDAEQSPLIHSEDPDQIFQRALDVELEKISSFYQLKELEIYGEVSEFLKDEESYESENADQLDGADGGIPNAGGRASDRPRQGSVFRSFHSGRRASTVSKSIDEGVEDSDDDDDENTALTKSRVSLGKRTKSMPYDVHGGRSEDMRASTEFNKSARRNSNSYDDYAEQAFSAMYSSGITLKKRAISLFVQLCELKSFIQLNKTGFTKVLKKYDKICDRNLKAKYSEKFVAPAYPFKPETIKHVEDNIARLEQAYADVVTQGDVVVAKKELRLHLREHVVWERNTVWREMIGIERKAQAANMGLRRTLLGRDNDPAKARLQGDDAEDLEIKELETPVGRIRIPAWLYSSTMLTLVAIIAVFFILLYLPIMKKVEQQNCLAMLIFVSLLWATEPMLRNLPSDSDMSKALILGIALASNIGGMLSPIASPQNIVALQIMSPPPSWGTWFFVVIPVGIISILLIWVILLVSFKPGKGTTIVPIRPVKDKITGIQWFISLVTLGTIILWCVSHQLEWLFGDMGVIAIIPLVLFFGTGILTKEDFNNFLWTIIILAAGGLSLGKAVNSSGLLHTIANAITARVEGFSLYGVLVVFASLILVVATFISHTVAALIILPLVHSVGMGMDEPHPNLLVMGSALMCSAAMGLPTSGFPNMNVTLKRRLNREGEKCMDCQSLNLIDLEGFDFNSQ